MSSKLIFGVTRIVSWAEEARAVLPRELLLHRFAEAYEELRRIVPRGDLIIRLQVEADSAKEVGVVFEDLKDAGYESVKP